MKKITALFLVPGGLRQQRREERELPPVLGARRGLQQLLRLRRLRPRRARRDGGRGGVLRRLLRVGQPGRRRRRGRKDARRGRHRRGQDHLFGQRHHRDHGLRRHRLEARGADRAVRRLYRVEQHQRQQLLSQLARLRLVPQRGVPRPHPQPRLRHGDELALHAGQRALLQHLYREHHQPVLRRAGRTSPASTTTCRRA